MHAIRSTMFAALAAALALNAAPAAAAVANSYPPTIPQTHVLTFEVIGSNTSGSTVSWSQMAPWLTLDTPGDMADAQAATAAGIRVQYYTDTFIQAPGGPFWTSDESQFAHDCAGNRITGIYEQHTIYLMNPYSPNLTAHWVAFMLNIKNNWNYPLNQIMADSADNLSKFAARPCNNSAHDGFDLTAWNAALVTQYNAVGAGTGYPINFNGLYLVLPNDGQTLSPGFALDASLGTSAGNTEECYSNTKPVGPAPPGTTWEANENTEIAQMRSGKDWYCEGDGENTVDASQAIPERLFQFASFLLTYKPQHAYLHEPWATASNFRQDPETHLVARDPADAYPSTISDLQVNGTYYARTYNACYMAGRFVGSCRVVVNSSKSTYPLDEKSWNHTLQLTGSDQFDGGTATRQGPPPPATIAGRTALILFQ